MRSSRAVPRKILPRCGGFLFSPEATLVRSYSITDQRSSSLNSQCAELLRRVAASANKAALQETEFSVVKGKVNSDVPIDTLHSFHRLTVTKSTVFDAGKGVILQGSAKKGTVLCFYSGNYCPPPPLWALMSPDGETAIRPIAVENTVTSITAPANARETQNKNNYFIHCDIFGGYLDGLSHLDLPLAYCCGQYINHPPKGHAPNVVPFSFRWDDVLRLFKQSTCNADMAVGRDGVRQENISDLAFTVSKINQIAGGLWFIDPNNYEPAYLSDRCSAVVGMAMVAIRDIQDSEELFLDYKYDKNDRNIPDWYTAVT